MSVEWYYKIRSTGEEFGPVTHDALEELAKDGRIAPKDKIRKGASGKWYRASNVAGLLPGSDHLRDRKKASATTQDKDATPDAVPGDVARYVCQIGTAQKGPFDLDQIREMISAGELSMTDLIRSNRESPWTSVLQLVREFDRVGMPLLSGEQLARCLNNGDRTAPSSSEQAAESSDVDEGRPSEQAETTLPPPLPSSAAPAPLPASTSVDPVADDGPLDDLEADGEEFQRTPDIDVPPPAFVIPPATGARSISLFERLASLREFVTPVLLARAGGVAVALAALAYLYTSMGSVDGRYPVHGTVSSSGRPVPEGWVSFIPEGGSGPEAFAEISEGVFEMSARHGPAEGAHRVVIDFGGGKVADAKSVNVQAGDNQFQFDVAVPE